MTALEPEAHAAPFGAGDVLRDTVFIYRRYFRRVAGAAVLVFGATAWLDALIELGIDADRLTGTGWDTLLGAASALVGTLGFVFYAGLLDKLLEDHLEGRPKRRIVVVARELPFVRLLVADLVLTVVTVVGLLLFVVPGVVAFTLFAMVAPVIVAEDRKVFSGMRRASQLARQRFWLVLGLVTVPVLVEEQIVHAIDYRDFPHPLIAAFLSGAFVAGAVISVVGLVEVVLARRLMVQLPATPSPTEAGSSA